MPIRGANETPIERIQTPETAQSNVQAIKGEDHLNLSALPPPTRGLAQTFFASPADPFTGEVWQRHTFARFKRFAAAHGTYHPAALIRAFQKEQVRARYAKRDAKLLEQARTLRADVLKKKSRATASRAADLHRKANPQAPIWDRMAGIYAAEEQRRAPKDVPTTHELWADVDRDAYNQIHRKLKKHAGPVAAAPPAGAQDFGDLPRSGPQAAEAQTVAMDLSPALVREGTLGSLLRGIQHYHERQAAVQRSLE